MPDIDPAPLCAIGLRPLLWQRLQALHDPAISAPSTDTCPMRVTEVHRDGYRLHDGHTDHAARARPRLLHALDEADTALAVGDWVMAGRLADGAWWIEARVPPENHLVRRDADGRRHPVVSNVDTALLVMGLDDDFNLRRLERYLALVQGQGLPAVVVLTKADVAAARPGAVDEAVAALRRRLPGPLEQALRRWGVRGSVGPTPSRRRSALRRSRGAFRTPARRSRQPGRAGARWWRCHRLRHSVLRTGSRC